MKKNIISSMLLLAGLSFFTACEDDRDSNPVIQQPTEFILNTPVYANTTVALESSKETINLSWSQPDYGFPIVANYAVQISKDGEFTTSTDQALADESGATVADYAQLDAVTSCKIGIDPAVLDKALNQLYKWEENDVPETVKLYIRVNASINTPAQSGLYNINSNIVEMTVAPYYMVLKDALPELWYLTGGCIGDGSWNNTADGIGTGLIPMSVVKDATYDKKTGAGPLTYTGYFPANAEFKIVRTPGDWNKYVFCGGSSAGTTSLRIGGDDPGNIKITNAGYYIINIAVEGTSYTCTIEPAESTPAVYEGMCITGDFAGWADEAMTPVSAKEGLAADVLANNHVWTYNLELAAGSGVKFKIPASWDVNWGSETFPYAASSVNGGPNIPVAAGNYLVVFNDITGSYLFIEK